MMWLEGIIEMIVRSLNLMIIFQTCATVKFSTIEDIPFVPGLRRPGCAIVLGHLHNLEYSF